MLECVANVSEGRDVAALRAVAQSCGDSLVDVHADPDHHRSVFTLAGPGPDDAGPRARDARRARSRPTSSLAGHEGVHPRLGALDVVPFVARRRNRRERRRAADTRAHFAKWWAETTTFRCSSTTTPIRGAPASRTSGATRSRRADPTSGPARPHPTLGATAVGARKPLVAVNLLLVTPRRRGRRVASRARFASETAGCRACARSG
jgi:glutamate formiminotransferase